jgi:hypothetical protein
MSAAQWEQCQRAHASKSREAAGAKGVPWLPKEAPPGLSVEEWTAILVKSEAASKLQVEAAASKASPQQLLQAAEKSVKQLKELERPLQHGRDRVARLEHEVAEARDKAEKDRAAALQAQVPSVAGLPCSAEHLFEGVIAKLHPMLAGAPEVAGVKQALEAAVASALGTYNNRVESERLQQAEMQKAAAAAKDEEERLVAERVRAAEVAAAEVARRTEEAADGLGMDVDGIDDDGLQELDPSNARPFGDDQASQLEQWRVEQRGTARKALEQSDRLASIAKRVKTAQGG